MNFWLVLGGVLTTFAIWLTHHYLMKFLVITQWPAALCLNWLQNFIMMPWHVRTAVHRSTLNLSHIWRDMRSFHPSVLSLMSCCAESRVTGDLMYQGDPVRSLPDFCSKTHRWKYLHLQRSKIMKLILMNVVLVYEGRFHVCFERYICSWNISNNVVNFEKCNRRHTPTFYEG